MFLSLFLEVDGEEIFPAIFELVETEIKPESSSMSLFAIVRAYSSSSESPIPSASSSTPPSSGMPNLVCDGPAMPALTVRVYRRFAPFP
jgi:hypothetical protein